MDNKSSISSDHVREIRQAKGMTQKQFAEKVGVGKITVARWESGVRECRGGYAQKVREIAESDKRTKTLFDVSTRDLSALDSEGAVQAFRDLLWCECRRNRIPTSSVQISMLEVPDGGIDAVLSAPRDLIRKDSFFPGGSLNFQIKAGRSWKPWLLSYAKKELLNKKGELGSEVIRCLADGEWYILVCFGNDLTPKDVNLAKRNFKDIFAQHGFADAKVQVWGQQQLLSLFSRFPFLSLQVIGRDTILFDSWSSWNSTGEMSVHLRLGVEQQKFLDQIKRLVREEDISHIRVIGEPGLGKTRLVHEALNEPDLRPQVVYIPHAEDFQNSQLFHDLLNPEADYFLILVLDECRPRDCMEIWDRLRNHSDRCKVITIDHDSYDPKDSRFAELSCPRLENEQVEDIINSYIGDASNSRRWAELCSGVPRVAQEVGRNLRANPSEIFKTTSMERVWEHFVSGNSVVESVEARQKRIVLHYISLFHRFGFESPVESEGEFIAEFINEDFPEITYPRFQMIVSELQGQKILQGKTTLFIAPKLLHVHLWTEFWEKHGRNRSIGDLINKIPQSLISWFVRMFSYAGESRVALVQVKRILGPEGPFSVSNFALSDVGCRFLHELSNASPEHALECLDRLFKDSTAEDLTRFQTGRHDIIEALERIAVWPKLFVPAARLLRKLAESENSSYLNNSTGVFAELFSLAPGLAAPTGTPPKDRLPVLKETLESVSSDTKRLGIKACQSALSIHFGGRVVGREYQGFKIVELWTPEGWGEVHDAMKSVWKLFFQCSREWDKSIRREANSALIGSAIDLLQISSLSSCVLDNLEELAIDEATDLEELVQNMATIRRIWKESYDPNVIDRLEAIDKKITGTSFSDRVRRIVHLSGWDDVCDERGQELEAFRQQVMDLAIEAAQSEEKFQAILPDMICGTNNVVVQFGAEFAKHDQQKYLEELIENYSLVDGEVSALFLSGYLATIFQTDPPKWEDVIEKLLHDEFFVELICPIIRNSGFSDRVILSMLSQYDSGALNISCLRSFGYAYQLKKLKEATFLEFTRRLSEAGQTNYVLELFDYVYCEKDNPRQLPEKEVVQALKAFPEDESRYNSANYHWGVVAGQLIKQNPKLSTNVFQAAMHRVAERHWYLDKYNPAYDLIETIIQSDPNKYWQELRSQIDSYEGAQRSRLIHSLGPHGDLGSEDVISPLTLFPKDAVFEWIAEDPETRAYEMTFAVPKSLAHDETGAWARELLNRYGDNEEVRSGLLSHFWAGGWVGNLSDRYRMLRDKVREWLDNETSLRIREWLVEFLDRLSSDIERSEIEEEREF